MGLAHTYSAHLLGLESNTITVEVDISNGLHSFSIIGLGDRSVEEAKDRVAAAIKNSGYISPKQKNQKVVVSLAPADVRKEGPSFDLAIALAYLLATGDINFDPQKILFLGELSLDGGVRQVSGVLPIILQAPNCGFDTVFIPAENAHEASLSKDIKIYAIKNITELIEHLSGNKMLEPIRPFVFEQESNLAHNISISVVRGNEAAKRALEIAAAGAHNVFIYGPPGTGKTLLARSLSSILPPLSYEQSLEVTSIHSAARTLKSGLVTQAPFRSPHHTASASSIIGGGMTPKPGEVTLAHRGVLFLDEFPEFDRDVIEALRQPLEERTITVSRMKNSVTFPAQMILVAAMNPCPCGQEKGNGCTCTEKTIANYWRKISGPIIDRVDIWVSVDKIDYEKITAPKNDNEEFVLLNTRERIKKAREIQRARFKKAKLDLYFNSELGPREIESIISLTPEARTVLNNSARKLGLSGRATHRVIKVAQTIADLENQTSDHSITVQNILEAISYRKRS